ARERAEFVQSEQSGLLVGGRCHLHVITVTPLPPTTRDRLVRSDADAAPSSAPATSSSSSRAARDAIRRAGERRAATLARGQPAVHGERTGSGERECHGGTEHRQREFGAGGQEEA